MIRRLPLLVLVFALVAGACSRPEAEPTTSLTNATTTTSTTTTVAPTTTGRVNPPSPLNGLPAEVAANLDRRVMAVKIDNHWDARPQSGLQEADAVYELLVEGGLTRFIALFHDNDSTYLGPMRSGRPTDPTLLAPLGATFTISGAQDWVASRIVGLGVPLIGEVRPATFRIGSRRAPHNLYVDTVQLRDFADQRGYADEPPPDFFDWGRFTAPRSAVAEVISLDWSTTTKVRWEWDGDRYLRFTGDEPHELVTEEGETEQIAADTLVVILADFFYTANPGGGSSLPTMNTTGSGTVLVFAGGLVQEGTWEREEVDDVFTLQLVGGTPLRVPPGVPWVSIFPDDRVVGFGD